MAFVAEPSAYEVETAIGIVGRVEQIPTVCLLIRAARQILHSGKHKLLMGPVGFRSR